MSKKHQKREADFKRDWINQHNSADEIVVDAGSKNLVAAIYYYPPTHHDAEQKRIWSVIAKSMQLEEMEEYDNA